MSFQLLNANQASIETDASGWSANNNTASVTRDATQHYDGTHSLLVTSTAAGSMDVVQHPGIPSAIRCAPGQVFTVSAFSRARTSVRSVQVGLAFFDASSAFLSTIVGPTVGNLTSAWTQATAPSITAPANAAWALVDLWVLGCSGGAEGHFWDAVFCGLVTSALTYEVLDRDTFAHKGWLTSDGTAGGPTVVIGEPTFHRDLNVGMRELQLALTQNVLDAPLNGQIVEFDMVKVWHPDGRVMGIWKYELGSAASQGGAAGKYVFLMHCTPIGSELSEVDYPPISGTIVSGNWTSADDYENQAQRGPAHFDAPVLEAIPMTAHCSVFDVNSDLTNYDMVFRPRQSRVVDTLNCAIDQGGSAWWWFVDGEGRVTLKSGPRATYAIHYYPHVSDEQTSFDVTPVINVQPVEGAPSTVPTVYGGVTYTQVFPLSSIAEAASIHPYSAAKIGRRVGSIWSEPTVTTQADLDTLAVAVLNRRLTPLVTRQMTLLPAAVSAGSWGAEGTETPRLTPGDQVDYTGGDGVLSSGLWVKTVEEVGSTRVQHVTLVSEFDLRQRPFRARKNRPT